MMVPMVQVGIVSMPMRQRCMAMAMRVRLAGRIANLVFVLVVLVIDMTVVPADNGFGYTCF
jgi:hypothetical protein